MSRKTITVKYGIQMKEPRRFPPWFKMLFILALIGGGIYLFYHFVLWVLAPTEEDIELMKATPTVYTTAAPTVSVSSTPTVRPSPTINPELSYELMSAAQSSEYTKGWVNIPGLGLDTVIVQAANNEYFKEFDINLNSGGYGAVYFDSASDVSYIFDAGHIVIYGYNNIGGRQLKSIAKYAREDIFNYNTLVVLETLYGKYHFRLFSVHIEDDDTPYVAAISAKEKKEFINTLLEKTMFIPDDFPEDDSVILTFSIDVESAKGTRLLVHAFLEGN